MTVAGLLLAAGESTRMGRLKQLVDWDGMPLVAWQAHQLRAGGADGVMVVLGHAADEIGPAVPEFATIAVNEAYREGRATSLRCGAVALPDDTEAVVILSVDQPRPAWLTRWLIERWQVDRPAIVSPRFSRGFGHPILLAGRLLPELREVQEATLGLRAVIDAHLDSAVSVAIPEDEVNVDLNTPSDYEAALRAFSCGRWTEPLAQDGSTTIDSR